MTPARVPAVFGSSQFGTAGQFARITDTTEAQKYIDLFLSKGYNVIDSARSYGEGTTEEILSKLDLKGATVDTKIAPFKAGDHSAARLKELVQESVTALNGVKIRTLYLHMPDRSVPFEETLGAVDELHKQGVFESFGLSNYLAWEVSEIVTICKLKGYVAPTVYQGIYNFIDRVNEVELFPCLRRFGIQFAAFSPLAGGQLIDHMVNPGSLETNSRFNSVNGIPWYRTRYEHAPALLKDFIPLLATHGLTLREVAVRWLVHHSQMRPDDVGICYGASKLSQLEESLTDHEKGPLPEEVVAAIDSLWLKLSAHVPSYAM